MNGRMTAVLAALVVTAAAECPQQQPRQDSTASSAATQETGQARVARLEREARALARTDGCTSGAQCRSAPVGERPCGGPRTYVVYCARTTDSAALYRKLAELKQAELEQNKASGAMSTCEFRTPPRVGLVGGQCAALP